MTQPKEYYTIRELVVLFNISRQALSKHLNKLEPNCIAKNHRGYKVILPNGVKELASILEQPELIDQLQKKDNQIDYLQKMLDQQQQLHLKAQNMLEEKNKLIDFKNNISPSKRRWYNFGDNKYLT